jgi:glycosyltransferase involved in cell wall biosynthesis
MRSASAIATGFSSGTTPICPGLTIIVPANNEEAYLASCLHALMGSDPAGCEVQLLVVANACTDKTVEVARSFEAAAARIGWTLQVIDLAQPGKLNALNVGDDLAKGGLRMYLDADVLVSPALVRLVVAELVATSAPRYASGSPQISEAQSAVTRAYAKFWQMLPFARSEAPGFGLFAVNDAGRSRWGRFPDIISDDTYVRLLFAPHERKGVPATYQWPMVEGFGRLVKVRRRQDQGVKEIAQKWPALLRNEGKPRLRTNELLALAIREPWGFLVYVAVTLAVRTRRASAHWTRGR